MFYSLQKQRKHSEERSFGRFKMSLKCDRMFTLVSSKCNLIFELNTGSPADFEYCVILIYRLKVSDRAGDVQVTFVFHISCVGVSVFLLLKKC